MKETLEQLQILSRPELIQKWKKLFGTNSPLHAKRDFLIKQISWEMQAKEQGGLSNQAKKQLDKLTDKMANHQEVNGAEIKISTALEIKPGTKLIGIQR